MPTRAPLAIPSRALERQPTLRRWSSYPGPGPVGVVEHDLSVDAVTTSQPRFERDFSHIRVRTDTQVSRQGVSTPTTPGAGQQPAAPSDRCGKDRCTSGDNDKIRGDIATALSWVSKATAAVRSSQLSRGTELALDWYFAGHSKDIAAKVGTRLECIHTCLVDTATHARWGCNPGYPSSKAAAYVTKAAAAICGHVLVPLCFTPLHFSLTPRQRAEVAIHECAHRVGMSPTRALDIYEFKTRFLYLSSEEALNNSDSIALFVSGIAQGIPVVTRSELGLAAGVAVAPAAGAAPTWLAQLHFDSMLEHPVLGLIHPTFGVGLTLIGEPIAPPGGAGRETNPPTLLASLLAGFRLVQPRPGPIGAHVQFFGGPALALSLGKTASGATASSGIGAEAGVFLGYRWRWGDVSTGVGYLYDPTRTAGFEHLLTGTIRVTFAPKGEQ